MKRSVIYVVFVLILLTSSSVYSADITVGSTGADYTTISQAVLNANDNDTIIVFAGTYNEPGTMLYGTSIGGVIEITKPLTIVGTSSGAPNDTLVISSTLEGSATSQSNLYHPSDPEDNTYNAMGYPLFIAIGTGSSSLLSNVTIRNLTLNGNFAIRTGIGSYYCDNILVENCVIKNFANRGIYYSRTDHYQLISSTISDIYVLDNKPRGFQSNSQDNYPGGMQTEGTISGNTFTGCCYSIDLNRKQECVISNNYFYSCQGGNDPSYQMAISFAQGAKGLIDNNHIEGCNKGIEIYNTWGYGTTYNGGEVWITNNTIIANWYGINMEAAQLPIFPMVCTSNTIELTSTSTGGPETPSDCGIRLYPRNDTCPTVYAKLYDNSITGFTYGIWSSALDTNSPQYPSEASGNSLKNEYNVYETFGTNSYSGNYYSDANVVGTSMIDYSPEDGVYDGTYDVNHHNVSGTLSPLVDSTPQAVLIVNNIGTSYTTQLVDMSSSKVAMMEDISLKGKSKSNTVFILFNLFFILLIVPIYFMRKKLRGKLFYIVMLLTISYFINLSCFGGGATEEYEDVRYIATTTPDTTTSTTMTTTTQTTTTTTTITTTTMTTTTTTTTTTILSPALKVEGTFSVVNRSKFPVGEIYVNMDDFVHSATSSINILTTDMTDATISPLPLTISSGDTEAMTFSFIIDYTNSVEGIYTSTWEIGATNSIDTNLRDTFDLSFEVIKP